MQSKAVTVKQYVVELSAERLQAITKLRKTIRKNLSKGFTEEMGYGMIGYVVPHSIYRRVIIATPNCLYLFFRWHRKKTLLHFTIWACMLMLIY